MNKNLINTNQSAKVALNRSRKLLDLTSELLDKKLGGSKFQFYLPVESDLTRIEHRAINSSNRIFLIGMHYPNLIKILISRAIQHSLPICTNNKLLKAILNEKDIRVYSWNEILTMEDIKKEVCFLDDILNIHYDESIFLQNLISKNQNISVCSIEYFKCQIYPSNDRYEIPFDSNDRYELESCNFVYYEIYKFAIQFVPKNARVNNKTLLQRLQRENSGAEKPFVWIENNLNSILESIKVPIDENPTSNIGVILPYGSDKENHNLSVQTYYKAISKEYACSKYYDGIKLKKLYNTVITTYDEAKLIDFDIIILPQFDQVKKIVDNEAIFNTICNAKDQLHIFQTTYDEYDGLVEIIDNRNKPL